jgi:hypothetical protein
MKKIRRKAQMTDITKIPLSELLDDLVANAIDFAYCDVVVRDGKFQYEQRGKDNQQMIAAIRAEIERRFEAYTNPVLNIPESEE